MLKLNFYDYSDVYILAKGTTTITGAGADAATRQTYERNKQLIIHNWAPFTDCISEICSKM